MNVSLLVKFIIYTFSRLQSIWFRIDDHRTVPSTRWPLCRRADTTQSKPTDLSPVLFGGGEARPTPTIFFGLKSYWYRPRAIAKSGPPPADLINCHGVHRVALQGLHAARDFEHQVNTIATENARVVLEREGILQPVRQSISESR